VNDNSGALVSCGNEAWCCQPDYQKGICDCHGGHGTFSLSEGHAVTIVGVNNLVHTATVASEPAGSTPAATTSSSTTSIGSTSGASSSDISTASSTTHISASSTKPTSASATTGLGASVSATSQPSHTGVTDTVGFRAGLGVGLGVLAIILIMLGVAYYNRSKDKGTLKFWKWRNPRFANAHSEMTPSPIPQYNPPIDPANPYLARYDGSTGEIRPDHDHTMRRHEA
jgi:hypothetical protein